MGGHGGLNILPQKRWNVYNFDNREKVRKDEEAAARDEQQKRDDARRRDAELRLQTLRQARGISAPSAAPDPSSSSPSAAPDLSPAAAAASDSGHINLFGGLVGFSSLGSAVEREERVKKFERGEDEDEKRAKKRRREEEKRAVVVGPEDEKYKLGYGLVGKGVKAPWYASSKASTFGGDGEDERSRMRSDAGEKRKSGMEVGKKTIEQLREERTRREKTEHSRERAVRTSALRTRVDREDRRRHSSRRDR